MTATHYDIAIIGGGIVGLATAWSLLKHRPQLCLVLCEKEAQIASHQTGHNSGVIHSGIYYRPGSLKAQFCVRGGKDLVEFCRMHHIPYQRCGKVIVAVDPSDIPQLDRLYERGVANGVPGIARLNAAQLHRIEPVVQGVQAIHLPDVGIVNFMAVAQALANKLYDAGSRIVTGAYVRRLVWEGRQWRIKTSAQMFTARYAVNCGGLYADRIARTSNMRPPVHIIPFRGEYYALAKPAAARIRGLVYPVPQPGLPFLGVHVTKMLNGDAHVGPNAVLALHRQGYTRYTTSLRDIWDLVSYSGFWSMACRHWKAGLEEWQRSVNRRAFLAAVQRLVPSITLADLLPADAGVRAQAVDPSGTLLDDFLLDVSDRALHVYNAPSPAATASLSIGDHIAERILAYT